MKIGFIFTVLLLSGIAGAGDFTWHYWYYGGITPDDEQILVLDRDVYSRMASETDTVYGQTRLGWWKHRKLRKIVRKGDFAKRRYSTADTGVFCEGGVVLTQRIKGEKTILQETCRVEKPDEDRDINRDRDVVKAFLLEELKRDGRKGGPDEFDKALAEFRKRMGSG